jgi:hyperosmotically inducible protein
MKSPINCFPLAAVIALSYILTASCSEAADLVNTNSSAGEMNTNNPANADNSKRNTRDRDHATLTPRDQGKSESDVQITRQIRKLVVNSTNHFSFMARNVKIITVDGKVTLRGPVKTVEEKDRIASEARGIAGENNVDDQLEIKSNP